MKITKLLSLLFLSLVFLSNGCNEDENLEVEGNCDAPRCYISSTRQTFRGMPEGANTWQYKILNGKKVLDKIIHSDGAYNEITYDNNGRSTGYNYYYDGNLTSNTVVTYNSNGQKETVIYTHDQDEDKTVFEYDSENRLKGTKYYYNGGLANELVVVEYNTFGKPTSMARYGSNEGVTETLKLVYDCNTVNKKYVSDNLIEIYGYDQADLFFADCEFGCRLNEITSIDSEGNITDKTVIEYDEKGLTKSYYNVEDDGEIEVRTYYEYKCD